MSVYLQFWLAFSLEKASIKCASFIGHLVLEVWRGSSGSVRVKCLCLLLKCAAAESNPQLLQV